MTTSNHSYRIIVASTEDDKRPRVRVLHVRAADPESAHKVVEGLSDKFNPDVPGIAVLNCRLEEALPFLREGFALRRDHWPITEVMLRHPHQNTRLDIYQRNPDHPHHQVTHLRGAKLEDHDVMSEDWHVEARPPYFSQ